MPSDPTLSVMYANFLIEVRKDGQAARTQLQLAQKANPTFLDNLNIYMAQQLAKQLKRGGLGELSHLTVAALVCTFMAYMEDGYMIASDLKIAQTGVAACFSNCRRGWP